jgi:hypothetical protein
VPSPAGHANSDRTRRTAEHDQACNRPSLAKDESVPRRQIIRESVDMRDYQDRASRSFGMKPTAERNNPADHLFQFSQRSARSRCRPRWPMFRLTRCAGSCRWSPARPGGRARAGRSSTRPPIFDQFDPTRQNQMHQAMRRYLWCRNFYRHCCTEALRVRTTFSQPYNLQVDQY